LRERPRRAAIPTVLFFGPSRAASGSIIDVIPEPLRPGRERRLADAVPALLAATLFGASIPALKHVFRGVDPWWATGWLYATAGVALAVGLAVARRGRPRPPPPDAATRRRGRIALVLATLCGAVFATYAELRGLDELPAGAASLLLNLEGVFTPLIAVAFFKERLTRSRWAGVALVLAGGVVCALATASPADGRSGSVAGAVWIAVCCLAWAIDSNLMRLLVHRPPLEVARDKGLIGGAVGLAIAAAVGASIPSGKALASGAAIGVLAYGVSVALYMESLRRIETAVTGALFAIGPFVGALVSWIAFDERPGVLLIGSGAAMAAGVWLLARVPSQESSAKPP